MPNQPRPDNKIRPVRVEDKLWAAVQTRAAKEGTTVSAVIRAALQDFTKGRRCTLKHAHPAHCVDGLTPKGREYHYRCPGRTVDR